MNYSYQFRGIFSFAINIKEKQRKLSTFCPDNPSLRRFGFKRLQDTLKYYPKLWNVKCPCGAVRREENVSNCHVYLELDCRERATDPGRTCKLYDLPTSLNLSREYRLAGVVSYDGTYDHFVAYCCRCTGTWEYHDELLSKVKPVKGNPVIQPECALYLINQ
ncbi:uncharacterized protein LOC107042758 [Diachasma alloeum]|uniref:uncharacterized protein LOC107042758 n=1 Tax=Diachasma alloeum TaxID=454923 RepID=UPI0007384830|nr:uncharacterized protein LOC107042758 [Diachasma alloeum]